MIKNQFDSGTEALLAAFMGENMGKIICSGEASLFGLGSLTPSACPTQLAIKRLGDMGASR